MTQRSSGADLLPERQLAQVMQQRPVLLGSPWHLARIAVAVTASWLLAEWLSASTMAIFAPVTTLLVLQASPWSTLGITVQRVLGTGLGVLVATLWVNVVAPTWWSFLVAVLASLLVASRLPWSVGGRLQIPIAVIFVMALGPSTLFGDLWRVLDVILGGAVGLAFAYLLPQRPDRKPLDAAMRAYRDAQLRLLAQMAEEIASRHPGAFLQASRRLRADADRAREALTRLAEATYLNPLGKRTREGLAQDALSLRLLGGFAVQLRGLAGAADRLYVSGEEAPALPAEECAALLDELRADAEASLGAPESPVASSDPEAARALGGALGDRLRQAADRLAASGAGNVLASLSLLGRIDHIRGQLEVFADHRASAQDDDIVDELLDGS